MFNPYVIPICFNFISWIRENLLEPLIQLVANVFLEIFIAAFKAILNAIIMQLCVLLYYIYIALLKILDMLQDIFELISGTNPVYYTYSANGVSENRSGYLTEILMKIPTLKNAFMMVWGLSIVLCIMFTVAAVVRSIGTVSGGGQSINDILKNLANCFVLFCAIQVITFGTAALSNVVTASVQKSINYAMNNDDARFSNYLFAATAMNARKPEGSSDTTNFISHMLGGGSYDGDWDDSILQDYVKGVKSYTNDTEVAKYFSIYKIDYISGAIVLIFILKFMFGASFVYIQRIVTVVVGFVIAPFFVAFAPLDGGERFKRWQDFYIGACFSSVGIILAVNIYLMLLPIFLTNGLIDTSVSTLDYFIKIYGVAMLSMALENCTMVFNRILSDSMIPTPGGAYEEITSLAKSLIPKFGGDGDGQGGGQGGSQGSGNGNGNQGGDSQGTGGDSQASGGGEQSGGESSETS
ncbi:MAG: hypothetical protein LUD81_03540 [Clostridiales bacterium]|nr:hypothetical protein [Clostridiales bacterium]